ncbi:MAG: glycerophosphodiester phosphodiesterase family protein [Christensenellales bacterium]|jgi:glycerophosphoryl diester phosphodiesterase
MAKNVKILIYIAVFLAAFGFSFFPAGIAAAWDGMPGPRPLIAAHRSGASVAPENTLLAFKTCVEATLNREYKVDIFEFDLRLTKDNELILLHDDTLNRTTDIEEVYGDAKKKYYPKDYTYAELSMLNAAVDYFDCGCSPYFKLKGEDIPQDIKIPRFSDVLNYLFSVKQAEKLDFSFIIEIKDEGERGKLATDLMHDALLKFGFLDNAIVGTFHQEISDYYDTKPGLMRSAGQRECAEFLGWFLTGKDLSNEDIPYVAFQLPKRLGIEVPVFGSKKFIDYAHKYGLLVQFWTVNDEKDISELAFYGADAIITDRPDLAWDVVNGTVKEYFDFTNYGLLLATAVLIAGVAVVASEGARRGRANRAKKIMDALTAESGDKTAEN